jgi:hypothetical protein
MTKYPGDIPKAADAKPADANAPKPSQAKPKPAPGLPQTKAERAARMRIDKMVIKRMRKR